MDKEQNHRRLYFHSFLCDFSYWSLRRWWALPLFSVCGGVPIGLTCIVLRRLEWNKTLKECIIIAEFLIPFLLAWCIYYVWVRWFVPFPICRDGVCKTYRDYSWDIGTFCGGKRMVNGKKCRHIYCRCGNHYLYYDRQFHFLGNELEEQEEGTD